MNPSVTSNWVCLRTPPAGHGFLQQCCLLWFVRGSRSQSIQRPRIHHHVFFSHLLQMKQVSNFKSDLRNPKSKQAKVKSNLYFLTAMWMPPSLLHQWMQWIEQLTVTADADDRPSHSSGHLRCFSQDATSKSTRRSRRAEEALGRRSIVLRAASAL